MDIRSNVSSVAFSPNGKQVASGSCWHNPPNLYFFIESLQNLVRLLDEVVVHGIYRFLRETNVPPHPP
jgi:hypothetical protein